ncbi:MAG: TonB-dependent receptor [Chryseolinea sp.]
MKIHSFIIIYVFCFYTSCFSQSKVIGKITGKEQALPLVNVVLLRDSIIVKAIATDNLGVFIFNDVAPGRYSLSASMLGYAPQRISCVVSEGKKVSLIPDIILVETSFALGEVTINSERQLVDSRPDRLVINVNGLTSAGNTMLEVLQKSPGVVVNKQSNTIAMNGRSGVRIMINEKLMQVSSDVAIQMLEGMSASNIDRIELITTPPAKYDAGGSGGIIHIITKKNAEYGTNGSATCTLGAHWAETLGITVNVNHRAKNHAYFIDYSILRNHNRHVFEMYRNFVSDGQTLSVIDHSHRENVTTQQNLSVGGEWNPSQRTQVNILLTGYRSDWKMTAIALDDTDVSSDSTTHTSMKVRESNVWQSATASIGVRHNLNEKSKLDFTADYLYYHNSNPSGYNGNTQNSNIDLTKSTPIRFFVTAANYSNTRDAMFSWDTGVKVVVSSLNNRVNVRRLQTGEWVTDPLFTSNSMMNEKVFAGYLSTQWVPASNWQINSGLRYEYTNTVITSATRDDLVNRKYGYFFPTITVRRNLTNDGQIYVSYNRRITRPTYNDIAPYVFFWGPNSFSAGNTSLYPGLSDAITVGYQVGLFAVAFQHTHIRREIVMMQPEIEAQTNSLTFRSQNLKYLNSLALTISYSIKPAPWWEMQVNVVGQHQTALTAILVSNDRFSRYGVNINMIHVVNLPNDFSMQLGGTYQSKTLSGVSYYLPLGSLNAGLQKKMGQSGILRLSMDDILNTNYWKIKTLSKENNFDVYFKYNFHNRYVRLTYTYNLGNAKLRSVKVKSGSEEERRRVNN